MLTRFRRTLGELKSKLEGMLSPKGHIEVSERTNALIVNDVTGNREQIARLALQLDTQDITKKFRDAEGRLKLIGNPKGQAQTGGEDESQRCAVTKFPQ